MNLIEFLDKELNLGISDVEKAAKNVEVDVIKGITFLEDVFPVASADLSAAGNILSVADPALASSVVAISQIVGTVDAGLNLLKQITSNPNVLPPIRADYSKVISIWNAQKEVISKALETISNDAINMNKSTVQAVEKAEANL